MQLLYNIAGIIIVILIIPMFMVRSVREKGFVERIRQSMGFFPEHALDKVEKKDCIWVHAASVGEIVATSPLIKEFRREFPKSPILVSVVTTSGYEMANRIIKDADAIIYFPLDLPWLAGQNKKLSRKKENQYDAVKNPYLRPGESRSKVIMYPSTTLKLHETERRLSSPR